MFSNCDLLLNYFTALELHKAVVARIVDYIVKGQEEVSSEKVQALYSVKDVLDEYIDSQVLAYESDLAAQEAKILDNERAVEKFLTKLDRDDT